jgi:hypothetical protein
MKENSLNRCNAGNMIFVRRQCLNAVGVAKGPLHIAFCSVALMQRRGDKIRQTDTNKSITHSYFGIACCLFVAAVLEQQVRHFFVAFMRRARQRSMTIRVLSRCNVQRRIAVVVFAKNQIRIVFDQRLDFLQVAFRSRVMNLAAKGEPAPGQRGQQDGGTAGNWASAEPTKFSIHLL